MIGGEPSASDHPRSTAPLLGGRRDHPLQRLGANVQGTGAGEQEAAGRQDGHRQLMNGGQLAQRLVDVLPALREGGGIEDDQIPS